MKKTYRAKISFGIGEINKTLKENDEVVFDDVNGVLEWDGKTYTAHNLKAAIKAEWLVPLDGVVPKAVGKVGETYDQESERKRKERFENFKPEENVKLEKDNSIIGCVHEDKDPNGFFEALDAKVVDHVTKGKFNKELIADDTKTVSEVKINDADTKSLKKALNQEKVKKGVTKFEVAKDHFDAETKKIGKYGDANKEETIKNWSSFHWTKKVGVIEKASREYLNELRAVEKSEKIIKKIEEKLNSYSV